MHKATPALCGGQGFSSSQLFDVVAFNQAGERCMVVSANVTLSGAIACSRGFNSGESTLVAVVLPVVAINAEGHRNALDASGGKDSEAVDRPSQMQPAAKPRNRKRARGSQLVAHFVRYDGQYWPESLTLGLADALVKELRRRGRHAEREDIPVDVHSRPGRRILPTMKPVDVRLLSA